MGKKKGKQNKYRPFDVNNPPTTSSAVKIVNKPNDSLNTSSELSVNSDSSKANESADNSLARFDEIVNFSTDSPNEITDNSCECEFVRSTDHKASEGTAFSSSSSGLGNLPCKSNENTTECTTRQISDEITNKFECVTLGSQTSVRRAFNSNYTQKNNSDNRIWETKSSHHEYNERDRNYLHKTSNEKYFYKGNRQTQRDRYSQGSHIQNRNRNVNNAKYNRQSKSSDIHVEMPGNLTTQIKQEDLGGNNQMQQTSPSVCEWIQTPTVEVPSLRNNTYSKEHTQYSHEHYMQEHFNENVLSKQENYDEHDLVPTTEGATCVGSYYCSYDDNPIVSVTELNANAETFIPTVTAVDDQFYNNQHKTAATYRDTHQGRSIGQDQYEKSNHNQNWREKDTTHNRGNKENSGFNKTSWGDAKTKRQSRDSFDRYAENVDKEYREFQNVERNNEKVQFVKTLEIQEDLFAVAKEYSLAHCVAEDMRMGSGIAVSFKRDFKDIDVLLNQRQKQGGLAVLEQEEEENVRYIYYLVTKRVSNGKPTYDTLWSSLKKMRDHIREHNVRKLAIPRLGCGLDRLEWSRVKHMIEFLFQEVEVEITVCNFQQTEDSPEKPLNQPCKVVHVNKSVANIEAETTIIYLSAEDGHVSKEMEQLNKNFSFLKEFKLARKQLGIPIKCDIPKKYYILYGCIIRKTHKDHFDFVSFRKCVSQINKNNKKDGYVFVAIQAIKDDKDDLINEKIITILRNYLYKVDVYVCWDGKLVDQMPISNRE